MDGGPAYAQACTAGSPEQSRLAALRRYEVLDTGPEPAFDRIVSLVRTVLGVPIAAVVLADADRLWLKSVQGLDGVAQLPRKRSFCSTAIESAGPLVIGDTAADPRFEGSPFVIGSPFIRSYAGVPLRTSDGHNVGTLCAFDIRPREFASDQVDLLARFGELAVGELELRLVADQDHLTGAASRRAFMADLGAAAKAATNGTPYCLAVFDIDRFKSVNDTWGHPVGDVVLRSVSATCAARLGPKDTLGRLGGEEFAILMPGTAAGPGMAAAEGMRAAMASSVVSVEPMIRVTASFGVAAAATGWQSAEAWLAAADAALYRAKQSGRNRCEAA